MNNTPIQINTIYMQACIKRMLAAIALIVALICPHAHALDTSPHWEEIDGVNRYGYWQEGSTAGYWDETAGYWDYSAGNGHFETIYSNPVYDVQGNFVSEDTSEVWVPDPVWVSAPQYVDQSTPSSWVDLDPPNDPTTEDEPNLTHEHTIDLMIRILEPDTAAGPKAWAVLRWSVDQDGNVIVNERTSGIGATWFIPGGGFSSIEGEPGSVGASIRLHGHAYSYVNPLNYISDSAIDWDMTAQMTTTHDATEGTLGGYHDRYPTYIVQIDGARVHYSHQGDFSGLGNPVGFSEWFMISRI